MKAQRVAPPLLLLRACSAREVVQRHLAHLRGRFELAGWRVVAGTNEGHVGRSVIACVDDPWLEPLPEQLAALAEASAGPRWRVPGVLGLDGPQGWHPRVAPASRLEYERVAVGRPGGSRPRVLTGAWPGVAVAPADAAEPLLRRGWPPTGGEVVLVPWVRMFRYHDPAAHARLELDPFIPDTARAILDVGCGAGLLGGRHRRPGRIVIGIEPDWELARSAAARLDAVIPAAATVALSALAPRFDCIVFADVLEHMVDPVAALAGAASLLTADGTIVVSLPNAAWIPILTALTAGRWDPTVAGVQARDHLFFTTPISFGAIAAEAGLEVVRSLPLAAPVSWRQRLCAGALAAVFGTSHETLLAAQFVAVLRRR